jgi:hypothetical protein
MNPFVGLILIFVCLIAAIVWILLYFFLIEGLLKKIVGAIFGVTIGRSRLEVDTRSYVTRSLWQTFSVTGWRVSTPGSCGCFFKVFLAAIGFALRIVFFGLPVGGFLVLAIILFFQVFGAKT